MAEWKTIEELFDLEKGSLQSSKCIPGDYPFITAAEEWKTHESYTHDCEALIFAMAASGSLGRTHYIKGKFISSDLCFIITPKIGLKLDLLFYYRLFNFLRRDIVKKTATGTSKLSINRTNFGSYKLPYFDYEHQTNFRGKIETLATINDNFFVKIHDQLNLIDNLRQQVLQEAIEGKLTAKFREQHPELISGDNHASKLLEKIQAEKERIINDDKKKRGKFSPILNNEKPFDSPEGWVWCRLGDICDIKRGVNPQYCEMSDYSILNQKCVRWNQIERQWAKPVIPKWFQGIDKNNLTHLNDVLVNSTGEGTIGRAGLVRSSEIGLPFDTHVLRVSTFDGVISSFLMYFINSFHGQNQISQSKGAKTTKQTELGVNNLRSLLIPLPPSTEQEAIVGKIEELLVNIEKLEKQISERKDLSEMLMQSVLREAFATN